MFEILHLNCGTMCPWGGAFVDGTSDGLEARLVCHVLVVDMPDGVVLVDTGFGTRDLAAPHPRLSRFFTGLLRPRLLPEETAVAQLKRRGITPGDVRHIVLTHLDFDHAGGIEDFPHAEVHLLAAERDAATHRAGFVANGRWRPLQWDEGVRWRTYTPGGEPWFGFPVVRGLVGLPPEILLVPLPGHTPGHAGVAVKGRDRWLLHAGDAYFHRDEINVAAPSCPPGLSAYQTFMEVDRAARLANQARLRELVRDHADQVRVVCAHDPVEIEGRGRGLMTKAPQRVLEPV